MSLSHATSPQLVTAQACIHAIFGTEAPPSIRTFRKWQADGWIPYNKIGRRTFFDPEQVRRSLDRRFKIEANP